MLTQPELKALLCSLHTCNVGIKALLESAKEGWGGGPCKCQVWMLCKLALVRLQQPAPSMLVRQLEAAPSRTHVCTHVAGCQPLAGVEHAEKS